MFMISGRSLILLVLLVNDHQNLTSASQPVISDDEGEYDKVPDKSSGGKDDSNATDVIHFVIFDAGSSGTRVFIYQFRKDENCVLGFKYLRAVKQSTKPGLSAYANRPSQAKDSIKKLLEFAKSKVPKEKLGKTWCMARATAGLRLVSAAQRKKISTEVVNVLTKSEFRIPQTEALRIITGKEEALFSWITINILTRTFEEKQQTFPIVEMGGGSLQFAIENFSGKASKNDREFSLLNGIKYNIHIDSFLGLGQKESVLRISGYNGNKTNHQLSSECFNERFRTNFSFGVVNAELQGSQIKSSRRFEACTNKSRELLAKLEVHSERFYLSQTKQAIYGISGVYFLMKFIQKSFKELNVSELRVHYPQELMLDHKVYEMNISTLEMAARNICSDVAADGSYTPYYCVTASVLNAYLQSGIGVNKSRILRGIGENEAIGWTLGQSLDFLNEESLKVQPKSSLRRLPSALTFLTTLLHLWRLYC